MTLEGAAIFVDAYSGIHGTYERLEVRCPCSNTTHKGNAQCQKHRGIGPRQCAHFGPMEPFGYIGAWLNARDKYESRSAHVRYNPTTEEVGEYMAANRLR